MFVSWFRYMIYYYGVDVRLLRAIQSLNWRSESLVCVAGSKGWFILLRSHYAFASLLKFCIKVDLCRVILLWYGRGDVFWWVNSLNNPDICLLFTILASCVANSCCSKQQWLMRESECVIELEVFDVEHLWNIDHFYCKCWSQMGEQAVGALAGQLDRAAFYRKCTNEANQSQPLQSATCFVFFLGGAHHMIP